MSDNVELVTRFIRLTEQGDAAALDLLAPDVVAIEYPNRITPQTARRDLAAIREAGERGRKLAPQQRFELHHAFGEGDTVAVELTWTATVSVPVGSIPAGGTMTAHFAAFYRVRDGKIAEIRNYDCFEPF